MPTWLIVIDLLDIVKFIKDMAIDKNYVRGVAKCNSLKRIIFYYNYFSLLYGVAKKNGVLQNVMLCKG